ncbi:hypothetical protein [Mesorhizobium sp. B4-1-4]|uniref:hypothetical protein n=1 Tax=Mesorhizobium sp. B4-1-4 TaxID=2589888 RepID=UPI0011287E52|nr:hypothetical protein [Mesorhizobium sp. B4-1-4]UCI32528.1 hypothetical protein FJW03_03475 [Mesorhizobium sp. B4-1-4]
MHSNYKTVFGRYFIYRRTSYFDGVAMMVLHPRESANAFQRSIPMPINTIDVRTDDGSLYRVMLREGRVIGRPVQINERTN